MWTDDPIIALNLGTTGSDVELDRIVTATVAWCEAGAAPSMREWLAGPGVEIPGEATEIHGVDDDMAREHGRPAGEVVVELAEVLTAAWMSGAVLVVFNAPFDLTFLDRELTRSGRGGLDVIGPVVDPLLLDRSLDRFRGGKRFLAALCDHYGAPLSGSHTSAGDALSAARLAAVMGKRFPLIGLAPAEALHRIQIHAYAQWVEQFETSLRAKKIRDGVPAATAELTEINRFWPLIPGASRNADTGEGNAA